MTTRREFIKISALGLGGMTFGAGALHLLRASSPDDLLGSQFPDLPTYCEVCFWKCAGWVQKDEKGNIAKVIGNKIDPLCNGRLCPRGTGGVGMYHDKDRLLHPLIRVTEGGKQTYRQASWEEALDLIAVKMKEVAAKNGPEAVAVFNHGSSGKFFGHLLKSYGSSNIVSPSYAQCRGPRDAAWKATYGFAPGSPEPIDMRDTRCLVLIGSHLGENMHNSQVQEMADAIDRQADIITVDPRYSTVASKSKYWLPIKPATDLALLLAWIHVVINEELYDKKYVEKYTYGFDRLKHHVRRFTPEWAYGITTIKPDVIRKTARLMADAAPATIVHPGRHVTWYGDDTQRSRAVAILNALLGSVGRRGGFFFDTKPSIPDFPTPPYPKSNWGWKDLQDGKYPLAGMAVTNSFIDASIPEEGKDSKLKMWIVTGTNLPLTLPQKDRFEKAVQSLDFIVVVDTMPMDITGYADVVLPECTYLERYDELRDAPAREPYIALRMPAVEPLGESKPAWWMAKELGERLGLSEFFPYEDYSEVLDWQLKQIGSSMEEMKKIGVKKFERTGRALYLGDDEDFHFATTTGKIELYSTEFEQYGFDPLPNYTAHPEPPENYYRMNYGRAPMHTFSRTANNPNLADLMDTNSLWVNPKIANIWNLRSGQEIWLKNQDGVVSSFPIHVRVTERIRHDSVYMVHGFGHDRKELSLAYGRGINDSELITNVPVDPIMGGTGMRSNFVTFLTEKPEAVES